MSLFAVSLSVFSLVPDVLFDCSRVLEYAKIRISLNNNDRDQVLRALETKHSTQTLVSLKPLDANLVEVIVT